MNFKKFSGVLMALTFAMSLSVAQAAPKKEVEYLDGKPLIEKLTSTTLKPVQGGPLRVHTITWPGDVATIHTKQAGIFKSEGVGEVELVCQNDFVAQVQDVIDGKAVMLRGDMSMINTALPAFNKAGTGLVVIYQLTWSTGGDCMVVRDAKVKKIEELKGKTIALQQYGPHVAFLSTILAQANLKPSDVNLKWLREITPPAKSPKHVDARSAFWADSSIDVCMVISPDAAALTDGSGESSVKGAKKLFSTGTARRTIADVYAVRKDYFDSHRDQMQKFVHALMLGEESFRNLRANKASKKTEYDGLMKESAKLLFDSTDKQIISDVSASLADCEWVGYTGNVAFFKGVGTRVDDKGQLQFDAAGTTRKFGVVTNEIQSALIDLKLMSKGIDLDQADWDYGKLRDGLKNVAAESKPVFDATKVRDSAKKEMDTELAQWEEDSLLSFEIYFEPNQEEFPVDKYKDDFEKALKMSQTLGGALISIEGHNNAALWRKLKNAGAKPSVLNKLEEDALNFSKIRAEAVRESFLAYCKTQNVKPDESQLMAEGLGNKAQKYPKPKNQQQWSENSRVVFRIKQRETELNTFEPDAQ